MLLNDNGPVSTADEDLAVLGLSEMRSAYQRADKNGAAVHGPLEEMNKGHGKKKAHVADHGDEDEGVEEGYDEDEVDAEVEAEAEVDEDVDGGSFLSEEEEEELQEAIKESVDELAEQGLSEDEIAALIDEALDNVLDEGDDEDCDDDDDDDDDEKEDDNEEDDDEDVEEVEESEAEAAAFAVLEQFYGLAEGQHEFGLDEAMGALEAFDCLFGPVVMEKRRFGKKGGAAWRGMKRALKQLGRRRKKAKKKDRAHSKGRRMMGGEAVTKGQAKKKLMKSLKGSKSSRFKKALRDKLKMVKAGLQKAVGGKKKQVADVDRSGTPALAEEITAGLRQLRESLETPAANVDAVIEGLQEAEATAKTAYTKIAEDVRSSLSEDERPAEDDPRIALGRHFEGIAKDAANVIENLKSGAVTVEDAAHDLDALSKDISDGLEGAEQID